MIAKELISKKRNKNSLSKNEIKWLVEGITNYSLSDSQVSALVMVIYFNGLNLEERENFTQFMIQSGSYIKLNLEKPIIDKHSTGGIGDNVSLILAPLLAACGCYVPMISGRSLGHTGGTLDKFDSIPGYNTSASVEKFINVVTNVGCAIIGQTKDVAPADKRLYKIRDSTGTIESIDLIVSSILSKKLSINLDALILDIKSGNGAFMNSKKKSLLLANALKEMGNILGCNTETIITDMSQPLCSSVGNSVEIKASIRFLKNEYENKRLNQIIYSIGSKALLMTKLANNKSEAKNIIKNSLDSGLAAEKFEKMVAHLGGSKKILDNYENELSSSKIIKDVFLLNEGFIKSIKCKEIGLALVELGGGRKKEEDQLDYSVGFEKILPKGTFVEKKIPICRIHASCIDKLEIAEKMIINAFELSDKKPLNANVILEE